MKSNQSNATKIKNSSEYSSGSPLSAMVLMKKINTNMKKKIHWSLQKEQQKIR
jgi:hypothetical protein